MIWPEKEIDQPLYWNRSSRCDCSYQTYTSTTNNSIWRMKMNLVLQCEKRASDYQSIMNKHKQQKIEYKIRILVTHNSNFPQYIPPDTSVDML